MTNADAIARAQLWIAYMTSGQPQQRVRVVRRTDPLGPSLVYARVDATFAGVLCVLLLLLVVLIGR